MSITLLVPLHLHIYNGDHILAKVIVIIFAE